MKIIFLFMILIFCIAFVSGAIAQEQKSNLSKERIEIVQKNELTILPSECKHYAVSTNNLFAFVDQKDRGYGKKIITINNKGEIKKIVKENCKIFHLKFSPDNKWFSYGIRNTDGIPRNVLINLHNNVTKIIENGDKECGHLDFSPDSKKFVYTKYFDKGRTRNKGIVVSDFAGNETIIAQNANDPQWSPKGDRIAFSRSEQVVGSRRWVGYIWIYDIDSREEIKLHNSKGMAMLTMCWSPDGTKIASRNAYSVAIINVDTDEQISIGSSESHSPCWSPDGLKIAFLQPVFNTENSGQFEDTEIYLANSDGTGLINISNTPNIVEDKIKWLDENRVAVKITTDSGVSKLQEIQFK